MWTTTSNTTHGTEVACELVSSLPVVVLRAVGSLSSKGQVTFIQ